MAVKFTKPEINVREKLAELDKPSGIAGEAMLRAETPQEQFNLIGAGRRNLIINGAMQVAQRGTSASVTGSAFTYETIDRIKIGRTGTDQLVVTASQATDAPDGFTYSHKLDVTTAESVIDAGEYYRGVQHYIEGQDLASLAYGTSSAKHITISFWVKSSKTGTYAFSLFADESTDRTYPASYSVDASGVWEYKSIVIEGDTASAITADNTGRLALIWYLMAGSTFTGGSLTGWGNYSDAGDLAKDHNVAWGTSTDDYWQITGIQMELGKVATPFEHRSYGEELALCQRYFERLEDLASTDSNGAASTETLIGLGYCYTTTRVLGHVTWKVTKRANPTCTVSPVTDIQCLSSAGAWISATGVDVRANKNSARLDITTGPMAAAGQACEVRFNTSSPVGY
ncbi:MAG: hypothetical protein ACKVJK_12885, partial [Methylophagaceae bacterium]